MSASRTNFKERKHQRVAVNIPATVRGKTVWVFSTCENISVGGSYVADLGHENIGSKVKIEFGLPGQGEPVIAEGYVVWRDIHDLRKGGGLAFTKIHEGDLDILSKYIGDAVGKKTTEKKTST